MAGAEVMVYVFLRFLFTSYYSYILPRNQTYAVAAVPTVTGSIFLHAEIQIIFGTV